MSESELAEFSRVLSPGRVSGYRWAVGSDARTAMVAADWIGQRSRVPGILADPNWSADRL